MLFFSKKYLFITSFKGVGIKFFSSQIIPVIFSQKINKETVYVIHKKNILLVLSSLKNHIKFQYKVLSCISGVDFLGIHIGNNFRFSVVYDLLSIVFSTRVRVKVYLNEMSLLTSSISVFTNANWWEREVWDMYGIWFEKHSDLRRILTDYGFDGFPLRKDFPLSGFIDLYYNSEKKRILSQPLELSQEFRMFSFEGQW